MLTLSIDAFWVSPYAMSCFVALEEKGLPYTVKEVGLHLKQHLQADHRARTGRVPALLDGDFALAESSAIDEYLEDAYPAPKYPRLYPADLKERAIARELQAWVRSDLMPLREERSTNTLFYASMRATAPLSEKGLAAKKRLLSALSPLISEGRTTLFGAWCIADADLALMLQRLNLNGDEVPPALKRYAEANWRRPSLAKWVAHPRIPYVQY